MPSSPINYLGKNKRYGFEAPTGDVSFTYRKPVKNVGLLGDFGGWLGFGGPTTSWKNEDITIPAEAAGSRLKFNEWWRQNRSEAGDVPDDAWRAANQTLARTTYNTGMDTAREQAGQAQERQDAFDAFSEQFDGSADGGAGSGVSPQLLAAIAQSYDRQIAGLGTNRTNAANLIQQFANQFKTNLQPITQQFQGATQASVAEIARRAAQGQADTNNLVKELSGSLTGLGVSAQPLQQQAKISAQQATQGSQYEQDFTNRLAQIAAMNDANALTNNELVRQGASGSLEQNYAQMLSALQSAKEQELTSAQMGGSSGSSGGGGGSDSLDQMSKYLKTRQLFNEVMGGGTDYTDLQSLMSAGAKKDPNAFLASILNMTPEQRQSLGIQG